MCGFLGVISSSLVTPEVKEQMKLAAERINHRGPDASSSFSTEHLYLAHKRLSIIDLSPAGNQPMLSDCGRYVIVFNGEIYNYRELKTQYLGNMADIASDTKVLLHLLIKYGVASVNWLNGMFSFCFIDIESRSAIMARDRFGEKPLYYTTKSDSLYFTSELKSFNSPFFKLSANVSALNNYLHTGFVAGPETVFSGVYQLPAANIAEISFSGAIGIKIYPYWDLLGYQVTAGANDDQMTDVISLAISSRLVSDVDVGVFLSGGVDSSSILAVIKHLGKQVHCFNCDFEMSKYSEKATASRIAEHYGYSFRSSVVTTSIMRQSHDSFIASMDQPTTDGFNTYLLSAEARKLGIKVWLSGTGGDEVFGGYPSFLNFLQRAKFAKDLRLFKKIQFPLVLNNLRLMRLMYLLNGEQNRYYRTYLTFRSSIPPNTPLFSKPFRRSIQDQPITEDSYNNYQLASYYESKLYLGAMLLRDIDNFSMAHSLEVRTPFLDHHLYESVLRKAAEQKTNLSKNYLTQNLPTPLPDFILNAPKKGFSLPFHEYLVENKDEVLTYVNDNRYKLWYQPALDKIYNRFQQNSINHDVIWNVYTLNKWLITHNVSI